MLTYCLLLLLIEIAEAQLRFFPQQSQRNFVQQDVGFPQPNQLIPDFQLGTQIATTAASRRRVEDVPNPDLEQGIFFIPDPRSWPSGPDWNDPRNNWEGINGWISEESQLNNVES